MGGPASGESSSAAANPRPAAPQAPSDYDQAKRPLYHADRDRNFERDVGFCRETRDGQLVRYDLHYLSSAAALLQIKGTTLASWWIWVHVLVYFFVAAITTLLVYILCERPDLVHVDKVSEVVVYVSALVAFMLAFYVSAAVGRWWELRKHMLGGLWAVVDDLTMILAAHFPKREHRALKTLVLRYGLASLELVFMEAQGTDANLDVLGQRGLLTEEERHRLEPLPAKAQVVWVWVAGVFQRLAEKGKLSSRLLVQLYGLCTDARAAIGGTFTHLDGQLPLAYVHLLAVMVHLSNLAVAVKCGVVAGVALGEMSGTAPPAYGAPQPTHSRTGSVQVFFMQVALAIGVPLFYQAFLEVAVVVSDPFGPRMQDFPRASYLQMMRDECESFQTTAEEAPPEIGRIVSQVALHDNAFVQDRVVTAV